MRPLFIDPGVKLPPQTLVVDCGDTAAATYSHWPDAPPAPETLLADTSTEIVLNAAQDPAQWLHPYNYVANNHIDADGLLSLASACHPELALQHRSTLVAAAEAGDFSLWTNEAGMRLMLTIHQWQRAAAQSGTGWEQRLCERVVDEFETLISSSASADPERDRQLARIAKATIALSHEDGCSITTYGNLQVIAWDAIFGHHDGFGIVDQDDDLPSWALSTIASPTQFQLLAARTATGITYQLDAPRHSWARTVIRPQVPWPDLTSVAAALQANETGSCQWQTRPQSGDVGFVCVLASMSQAKSAESQLKLADVVSALAPSFH